MFVIRCFVDLLLLSWFLEKRVTGIGLLLANLALLLLAAALPLVSGPLQPLWLAGSALLLGAAGVLGLVSLPVEIRGKLMALVPGRRLSKGV